MNSNEVLCIDELKICYVTGNDNLTQLNTVEVGGYIDLQGFRFYRVLNDRFRFFFDVTCNGEPVAQLKFGHYTDIDDANTYVYFKVLNHILYDKDRLRTVLELPMKMGMHFNNYTAIDLAYDSSINIPSLLKKMMRDNNITTIINGKAVKNRKSVLRGVSFEYSSSLNRLIHPTITIKQAKAMNNKSEGITVQAYDKKEEIERNSNKQYILNYHGNPKRLYRLEVRLHYQELKDYFLNHNIIPTTGLLFDNKQLLTMFLYHLGTVIRFTKGRTRIQWIELFKCNGRG